ncbi:hypothetical protein [Actinophytocola sp. NPDC049390]|uniref:hypothetical protein n=1 Tax=Actinophytocola sp. NPDC049390 TaxID=3363894 RepID=UPI003798D35B
MLTVRGQLARAFPRRSATGRAPPALGARRVALLAELGTPRSTAELAARHRLGPATGTAGELLKAMNRTSVRMPRS